MWGVIPAAGRGSRIQPLAFSKELLPVGSRLEGDAERPCAVSEYLVERMIRGGATKICFVISPGKSDILQYYGSGYGDAAIAYVVQQWARGLCDAIFCAEPLVRDDEPVVVGLPDTVWFPEDGLAALPNDRLSFLLFPVERPEFFDAVVLDEADRVLEIQVKRPDAASRWIWGAFKMPGRVLRELKALWLARQCQDEFIGTLVNAYLAGGGEAVGVKAGRAYVDVGTLHGYRQAIGLLSEAALSGGDGAVGARVALGWPGGRALDSPKTSLHGAGPTKSASPASEALWAAFERLPEITRDRAKDRLEAVQAVERMASEMSRTAAVKSVARKLDISESKLWELLKIIKKIPRADWLPVLAPKNRGRTTMADCDPRAWELLVAECTGPHPPAFEKAYCNVMEAAREHSWGPIPHKKTLRRWIERELPEFESDRTTSP